MTNTEMLPIENGAPMREVRERLNSNFENLLTLILNRGFVWTGKWDHAVMYQPSDVVTHNNNLYVAVDRHNNIEPPNDGVWHLVLTGRNGKSAFEQAQDAGFTGTIDDWIRSLQGRDGVDGKEVEFKVVDKYIKWRYTTDRDWQSLVYIPSLKGDKGDKGLDGNDGLDGTGIRNIASFVEGNVTRVAITLTDGTLNEYRIPNPTGIGGVNTEAVTDGVKVTITLTNGDQTEFTIKNGIRGEKGDRGEPLRFEDLTPEQIERLRGPKGDPGQAGSGTGDMLGSNNLLDVHDKLEARTNLGVYSKSEVDTKASDATLNAIQNSIDNYLSFAAYDQHKTGVVNKARIAVDAENSQKLGNVNYTEYALKTQIPAPVDISGKADRNHTHSISDINLLQNELDKKANKIHDHSIANVTGLQNALDGKANINHTHTIANVVGLQTALNGKSNNSHTHAIANITGLQAKLNDKAGKNEENLFTKRQRISESNNNDEDYSVEIHPEEIIFDGPDYPQSKISSYEFGLYFSVNGISKFEITTVGADLKNNRILNLADPINPQDAVTKRYLENNAGGGGFKNISNIVREKGLWKSFQADGKTYTNTREGEIIKKISDGTKTYTLNYDSDGNITSITS